MKKETALCMGCMTEKTYRGDCKVCGYPGNGGVTPPCYLTPKTFLAGRYIIGKLIRCNGEGALYLAFDCDSDTKVTIKEYMPDTLCERAANSERLVINHGCAALYKTYLAEFADLHGILKTADTSLNIQKVRDIFYENNTVYAVYEYIEGKNLKSFLLEQGGYVSWAEARRMFPPILETLAVLNKNGLLHRGLSPATIVSDGQNNLKIISFGITASRTHGSALNFEVFGGYAAPEQYNLAAHHGSWTDVYGISAVIYKSITGQTPPSSMSRSTNDNIIPPKDINPEISYSVSDVIVKGLALRRDERVQTTGELLDLLFNARNHASKSFYKSEINNNANYNKNKDSDNVSDTTAVVVCAIIGLVIVGFIIAIAVTASHPNNHIGVNSDTNTSPVTNTRADLKTEEPVTSDTPDTSGISGTSVNPTVSEQNHSLYVVPDFISRTYSDKLSTYYSFFKFTAEFEFNSEYKAGTIFSQSIPKGSEVLYGTEITVKISKGAATLPLPDYTGLKLNDYITVLDEKGIKYITEPLETETVVEDTVVKCDVLPGDPVKIEENQEVIIYYAVKPKEVVTDENPDIPEELPYLVP